MGRLDKMVAERFKTGWYRFVPFLGYHHVLMILIAITIILLCKPHNNSNSNHHQLLLLFLSLLSHISHEQVTISYGWHAFMTTCT